MVVVIRAGPDGVKTAKGGLMFRLEYCVMFVVCRRKRLVFALLAVLTGHIFILLELGLFLKLQFKMRCIS